MDVLVSGDLAVVHYIVPVTWTDKNGTHPQTSRYTGVDRKQGGMASFGMIIFRCHSILQAARPCSMPGREMAEGVEPGGSLAPNITARGLLKIDHRNPSDGEAEDGRLNSHPSPGVPLRWSPSGSAPFSSKDNPAGRPVTLIFAADPGPGWSNEQGYAGRMRPDNPAKSNGVRVHPARMCSHRYQRSNDAGTVAESRRPGFGRQYSP